ncbi:MAG: 2-methylcitrate dehydratase [Betaproteobacteria bacterium RIFCSPLOWO2_12_FULL_62_13]|nr:MAG: 2-methylcitrate dehydratase [Betaproteobacteria bacterium RIFCSPLOWO2_12_FULL_62_13]
MEVTRKLARFIVEHRYDDIPENVRHEAARAFLNWVGCAVGGSRHETVERALAALAEFSGPAQATVLGRGDRLDIMQAALMNGITSHTFDFDDTHLKTVIHPSGPVASAILAFAESQPVKGEDFLHALILGVEVECRIGNAVYPAHYDVGWHITGTAGVFGAAAAAGRLLGLNEQQMVWALGIAATQSSGLRELFGTMCKPLHIGNAAKNGLLAALLAKENFTSSNQGIEAKRGFGHVLSTEFKPAEITERLGETWEIALNTYKPFACGIVNHPAIDGCIQLRNEHKLEAEDIESISLKVHPLVLELTGKKTPQAGLEGKFSVYHSAAVAIVHGAAGEAQYSDACVRDPKVIALRDRVSASVDRQMREDQVRVAIRMKDGRTLDKFVERAIGSVDRPMSDADLEAKFRSLTDGILSKAETGNLIRLCWDIGRLEDAAEVARASVPTAEAAAGKSWVTTEDTEHTEKS